MELCCCAMLLALLVADVVRKCSHLLATSYCPAVQLELVGPLLRISGLAFANGVVCEPLTPFFNLLALHRSQPHQVCAPVFCVNLQTGGSWSWMGVKVKAAPAATASYCVLLVQWVSDLWMVSEPLVAHH
jgi:hypothetical protein